MQRHTKLKNKSIDYIFGMITGAIQQVEVVNESWNPVNVSVIE